MTTTSIPTRDEIRARVIDAIGNATGQEVVGAEDSTRLFEDLNFDSTSVLGMLMELEDSSDLEVDPEELEQEHLETIGSLTDFIVGQLAAQREN